MGGHFAEETEQPSKDVSPEHGDRRLKPSLEPREFAKAGARAFTAGPFRCAGGRAELPSVRARRLRDVEEEATMPEAVPEVSGSPAGGRILCIRGSMRFFPPERIAKRL